MKESKDKGTSFVSAGIIKAKPNKTKQKPLLTGKSLVIAVQTFLSSTVPSE